MPFLVVVRGFWRIGADPIYTGTDCKLLTVPGILLSLAYLPTCSLVERVVTGMLKGQHTGKKSTNF